ncbi:MAG: TIGR04076 family protein [Theionarchaea archaeon]|nr:TIGR04076 family protein [Theionarchaea archaeon]
MKEVEVTVVQILEGGECPLGYTVGDTWTFGIHTPPHFCHWAYLVILPFATVLRFDGSIPWEEEGRCTVCCPDPHNPVVFEIKQVNP